MRKKHVLFPKFGFYDLGVVTTHVTTCAQLPARFLAMAERSPAVTSADRIGLLKVFGWQNGRGRAG